MNFDGPKKLAGSVSHSQQQGRLREASKLYEQQFLREMVKAMRSTVKEGGLIKKNFAEKLFQEQLDSEYVKEWSKSGGVGLADMIYKQLQERLPGAKAKGLRSPQGPLPLNSESLRSLNPEVKSTSESSSSHTFHIRPGQSASRLGTSIHSPWEGKLARILNPKMGETEVQIEHENGWLSQLSFEGQLHGVQEGDRLFAGQKLGSWLPSERFLSWRVTDSGHI